MHPLCEVGGLLEAQGKSDLSVAGIVPLLGLAVGVAGGVEQAGHIALHPRINDLACKAGQGKSTNNPA